MILIGRLLADPLTCQRTDVGLESSIARFRCTAIEQRQRGRGMLYRAVVGRSTPLLGGAGSAIVGERGQHVRRLFAFVNSSHDRDEIVERSRETLRRLGKQDDRVLLHLPFSPTPSGHHDGPAVHTTPLPAGYAALTKTAVIEIHNPSARNALSGKMMAELADIVELLEREEVHGKLNAVALVGHGGWFCAGADLRVAKQQLSSREAGAAMGALMVDTLTRFRRLPLVSVACIEGGAFGGGAELATACDFRLMSSSAVIQFVQARMGVSPGWGGGARLYKLVGRQNALRLLCTAEKLSAARSLELQLADETFDQATTDAESATTAFLTPFDSIAPGFHEVEWLDGLYRRANDGSPVVWFAAVSHGAKRVINNADDVNLDDVLSYEHNVFKTLWGGPANLEALEHALKKSNKGK